MNRFDQGYLALLQDIMENGEDRMDRTGVGTRAVWCRTLRHDLKDGLPALTTKKVAVKTAIKELIWFLTGDTNIQPLVRQNVSIWTDWPLKAYREATGEQIAQGDFERRIAEDDAFAAQWGDLGPVYGKQWRRWLGADGREYDQIAEVERKLKEKPWDRRIIFTGWNVPELDRMALPPCHHTYQFSTIGGRLNAFLYQRSCDTFLGVPFNVVSLGVLTTMLAQATGWEPGEIVWTGTDVHIYQNHFDVVRQQMARPGNDSLPRLEIARPVDSIDDIRLEDLQVTGYTHDGELRAPVAV